MIAKSAIRHQMIFACYAIIARRLRLLSRRRCYYYFGCHFRYADRCAGERVATAAIVSRQLLILPAADDATVACRFH